MKLSNFRLLKEDENSYEVAHPSGKKMVLEKKGLSKSAQELISKLKGDSQKYDAGGEAVGDEDDVSARQSFSGSPSSASVLAPNQSTPPPMDDMLAAEAMSTPAKSGNPVTANAEIAASKSAALPAGSLGTLKNPISGALEAGLKTQEKAYKAAADAIAGQGKAEVAAQNKVEQELSKLESIADIQKRYAESDAKYKEALDKAQIDPNRFWNNKSVPAKISSALGMILSGAGSGVTGQANMAQAFIQKAIETDVEAQKADQSKAMNAWKMNREALGSDIAANVATRNQAYVNLSHQLDKAASQFKGPMAHANYLKAKGMIDQRLATNRYEMSLLKEPTQETAGGAGAGSQASWENHMRGLQNVFPERYKELQGRFIPSVGIAKIEVPQDEREALTNYDELSKKLSKALEFQREMGRSGAWSAKNRAEAESIRNDLVLSMNSLYNSKRPPSPEIMKLYKESVDGIGTINAGVPEREIIDLQKQLSARKKSVMDLYGVRPFRDANTSGERIVGADGITYMRGPDGKAVPVK